MKKKIIDKLLGTDGKKIAAQRKAAVDFLDNHSEEELLKRVGTVIEEIPEAPHIAMNLLQRSYHKNEFHLVAGRGLFFIDENNQLYLDCTSGHYQMTWGYDHPVIRDVIRECLDSGVVWDCHSNIPGNPVKRLGNTLLAICNDDIATPEDAPETLEDAEGRLNRVNLGTATGTAACSTAIKVALKYHLETYPELDSPVLITHNGNYHGTDIFAQRMRGMWKDFFRGVNVKFIGIDPNDHNAINDVFRKYGKRCALFMTEPIMMNREALRINEDTMHLARELCTENDTLFAMDEIQTCFWTPEIFAYKSYDIIPDALITGKGMTCGFHPLSAALFNSKYDNLEQYDSLNTNGSAPMAAYAALANIDMIQKDKKRIAGMAEKTHQGFIDFAADYPETIKTVNGEGFLSGLKFDNREVALALHEECVNQGVWLRAHAYHEGHSTVLTKFALAVNETILEYFFDRLHEILRGMEV